MHFSQLQQSLVVRNAVSTPRQSLVVGSNDGSSGSRWCGAKPYPPEQHHYTTKDSFCQVCNKVGLYLYLRLTHLFLHWLSPIVIPFLSRRECFDMIVGWFLCNFGLKMYTWKERTPWLPVSGCYAIQCKLTPYYRRCFGGFIAYGAWYRLTWLYCVHGAGDTM